MKISKKRTVQVMVFAIALLLVLALSIGITGAWYQAKRQASGTVIMDQGIIIDYKGFAQDAPATTWGKGVNLKLFTLTDDAALPGQQIPVNSGAVSSIKANAKSVDFYARVKLDYKFYNVVGSTETEVTTLADPSALITTSENFFGTNWVKSQNNDGWFYYGTGTTLGQFTKSTDFVALFADGAKFIIEGANFVGADDGKGGGFVVNETTSINKIEVTLTLETLQGSADAAGERWSITPIPVVENFSSNKLINDTTSEELNPETTTLAENTTYQVVDASNAGYKFTITKYAETQASSLAQTLASVDVSVVNGEATIIGYTGSPTELTIPDYITVNGEIYKVTSIGSSAFYNCSGLTSIIIPDSVTSIGSSAFSYSNSLISITIPNSVTSIGSDAFYNCTNLKFATIPNAVTIINSSTFHNCFSLIDIKIPDSVIGIKYKAFLNCRSLNSIEIPNKVIFIDSDSFYGCSDLESIIVVEGNTKYSSSGNCLIETASKKLILGCKNSIIPDSVTSIGNSAFYGCSGLKSITIPDSVTKIEIRAFESCINLQSVKIGSGVNYINMDENVFRDCDSLVSIIVAEGNTKYHSAGNCLIETESKTLIAGCKNSIIPTDNSVTIIGSKAFANYVKLTSITIPNNITVIGADAFFSCSGLTSIIIPDSVTSIRSDAFKYCYNLNTTIGAGWVKASDNSAVDANTLLRDIRYNIKRAEA